MRARRWWAWPLVPLYAAGQVVENALRGEAKKLGWPVVSVGSVSAGGAGKTPVVIALVNMLEERGWLVDVLTRGYGRHVRAHFGSAFPNDRRRKDVRGRRDGKKPEKTSSLVHALRKNDVFQFGDEPVLIARATTARVLVGADRYESGMMGELAAEGSGRGVHVMDDGFQHRQLAREVDVVLVTAEDLGDALLPAGNRRERWSALQRASAIVVREDEFEAVVERVRAKIGVDTPIWIIRRRLVFPKPLGVLGAGLRPMAFCGIARPENFEVTLRAAGCGVIDTMAFRDHQAYEETDIRRVVDVAKRLGASGVVTTEKDAVKLTPTMYAMLETVGPVMVVGLEVEFVDAAGVAAWIEGRIR